MAFLDSLGKKQTYRKSPTSTTQAFPSYPMWLEERGLRTRQCGVRVCTFGEDAGGGGGGAHLCVCPAKYFLHYTANPISSFRKLQRPFKGPIHRTAWPMPAQNSILLTANQMHSGLSLPRACALASLPPHTSQPLLPLTPASPGQGDRPVRKLGGIPSTK